MKERFWKKLSSSIAHKNPWYSVREDDVLRPDGQPGKYFVVDFKHGVIVIARDKEERIYLVGQNRYSIGEYSWELVIGTHNDTSDLLAIAKMELREETGLEANEWKELGYIYPNNGWCSQKLFVFLATELTQKESQPEATEDIRVKNLSISEILEQINNFEIHDGPTIAAIMKYILHEKIKIDF